MKNKAIILLLLVLSIACTSADYAATFHLDYEPTTAPMPTPSAEARSVMTMPARRATPSPTPFSARYVCTGVENGTLRVRNAPGVNHAMIFTLHEGQRVSTTAKTQETNDGATWIKITNHEGWVNQRFLCEEK